MRRLFTFATLILISSLFISANIDQAIPPEVQNLLNRFKMWNDSIPEDRVYLHFDKPFYEPGDTIWFSSYVRDAGTLKQSVKSEIVYVNLINPKGSIEQQIALIAKHGQAKGDFTLSNSLPGGIYKIKAWTNWQKNDPDTTFFTKDIQIQEVVMPRLKMKFDFVKKGYGPGDKVEGDLTLETNENRQLSNHTISFVVSVDGKQILERAGKTSNDGKYRVQFNLPNALSKPDGIVNVMIPYDGLTESISRSIPIVLNTIKLSFFPEGGDLVNNLKSKVAFKALNEHDKGADIEGFITDQSGRAITQFTSKHLGMGSFEMTPQENKKYKAHITKPLGVKQTFDLPEAMPQGYVLQIVENRNHNLKVSVGSTREEKVSLLMQIRGKVLFTKNFKVSKGTSALTIPTDKIPQGVAQITLFDSKGIERAERLVFVNKEDLVKVSITTDKEQYAPREKVTMKLTVTDETGMRMPGHFSLAVIDDQLVSFSDDKSSTILSQMLLEADVKGKIEEPAFYFDPKETDTDVALDNLLLTQGWRRFTWQFLREHDKPEITFPSELAKISGIVYDGSTGKPLEGAIVKIIQSKSQTTSDKNGYFTLNNIELYEPKTLHVEKGSMQNDIQIDRYSNTLQIHLYTHRPLMRAAPAPFGIKMRMVEEAVGAQAIPQEALKEDRMVRNFKAMKNLPKLEGQVKEKKGQIEKEVMAKRRVGGRVALNQFAADEMIAPVPPMDAEAIVYYRAREFYSPDYKNNSTTEMRSDFRQTLFWKGDVEVKNNGTANIEFYTNDAITSFRVITEGLTINGGVGRAEKQFYSQKPFTISTKLPRVLVTGDTIKLPIILKNNSKSNLQGDIKVDLPDNFILLSKGSLHTQISPLSTQVIDLPLSIQKASDSTVLNFSFTSNDLADAIQIHTKVINQGFPVDLAFSGNELSKDYTFNISDPIKGTLKAKLTIFPSVVNDLLTGIESILQEPSGCFEQTSMSSYPNTLVLSYLKSQSNKNDSLKQHAESLLERGYSRLTTFETKEKGYEWFGAAPGHEALTAYGLMQFEDMAKVSSKVDRTMIERTSKWLLSRRDGKGGFLTNPRALDSYGRADLDITNAYIVYALIEAGRRDVLDELNASVLSAEKSLDPYVVGLVCNALFRIGDNQRGDALLSKIIAKQAQDGSWCGTRHSITRSEGISLKIETTSLITMAQMLSKNVDNNSLVKGIKFIMSSRSPYGGFGATQSTIMALKALTAYAQFARKTDSPGIVILLSKGNEIARKSYKAGEKDPIIIDSIESKLIEGENQLSVKFTETKQALPFSLTVHYNTRQPNSSKECKVNLETNIPLSEAKIGQTVRLTSTIKNLTSEGLPMTVAVIGLPAGLSAQPWQLKEVQEKKLIDFYEISGNTLIFYFRQMEPNQKKAISLDLKAEIPGHFTAPASRAYLYYTNEYKHWSKIGSLRIQK